MSITASPALQTDITFTDIFCGGGGSSTGFVEAGLQLALAANHWAKAIETHSANHRTAEHLIADTSNYDMRALPFTDVLWISPECTWHSPAGGRKRAPSLDIADEYVPNEAGERSRATMWDVVRATEARNYKIVVVENVVEVTKWNLFEVWLSAMERLGYSTQILCASAAHIYSDFNAPAPQWRDRIYFIFTRNGITMPDLSPRPWAVCDDCGEMVQAKQSWKRADRRPIGKYRAQYVYVCPSDTHARRILEPLVAPAAAAIDWTDLGIRIGDRESLGMRQLAPATYRRIRAGARMFARPTVVASHGQTWDAARESHPKFGEPTGYLRAWPAETAPLNARTGTSGDALSVPPFITYGYDYNGGDARRIKPISDPLGTVVADGRHHQLVIPPYLAAVNHSADEIRVSDPFTSPLPTRVTKIGEGLVNPPYLVDFHGTGTAAPVDNPLGAITAGGNHHGLTIPDGAYLTKHHGGIDYARIEHMTKSVDEPMPSLVTRANVSLVIPYRKSTATTPAGQSDVVTADVELDVNDFRFRMLGWREHATAQRFPSDYVFTGNKGENSAMAGNAVAVNVARYIGENIAAALS